MSERTKKIYHKVLLILSAALLLGFFIYLKNHSSSFEKIKYIDLRLIFLLVSLHALNYLLLGITHFYPLRRHKIFLRFREWYGLCTVSELFNLLLPAKGGTALRMMYINEKKELPIRELLSMGLSVIITGFSLLGILGVTYCHFFLEKNNLVFSALESLFVALIISAFLMVFSSELLARLFKVERKYSLKKYLTDKKIVSISLLCYMGMFILYPLKIFLSFKAIGVGIHLFDSLEISLILLVSSFFQILPGNIGIKEIATGYIAKQYGIDFELALLASLVDRAILLLFLFPFGAYFYWNLLLDSSVPKINWARIPFAANLLKMTIRP